MTHLFTHVAREAVDDRHRLRVVQRVRCYGIWAGSHKERKLAAARKFLPEPLALERPEAPATAEPPEIPERCVCPKCGAPLYRGRLLIPERSPPLVMPLRAQEGDCHAA